MSSKLCLNNMIYLEIDILDFDRHKRTSIIEGNLIEIRRSEFATATRLQKNKSNWFICMFWAIMIILKYAWKFTANCTFHVEPLQ